MTDRDFELVMNEARRLRRDADVHDDTEVRRALFDAADRLENLVRGGDAKRPGSRYSHPLEPAR